MSRQSARLAALGGAFCAVLAACVPDIASERVQSAFATLVPIANPWVQVVRSDSHILGIRADGTLWAWGSNTFGELGQGDTVERHTPTQVGTNTNWKQITAGTCCGQGMYSIGLQSDGTVWSWGGNQDGTLGLGGSDISAHPTPQQVPIAPTESISSGGNTVIALLADGEVWMWGRSNVSQLGPAGGGSPCASGANCQDGPVPVSGATIWTDVFANDFSAFAVQSGGAYGWGFNNHGELALGTIGQVAAITAIPPPGIGGTVLKYASGPHTLAIRDDHTLWGAGYNQFGQLGLAGNLADQTLWTQIGTDADWVDVAANGLHSHALKQNGTMWAWGLDDTSQLGYLPIMSCGGTPCQDSPLQVGTDAHWSALMRGGSANGGGAAIRADGTLWTWGLAAFGEAGDGSVGQIDGPQMVPLP